MEVCPILFWTLTQSLTKNTTTPFERSIGCLIPHFWNLPIFQRKHEIQATKILFKWKFVQYYFRL